MTLLKLFITIMISLLGLKPLGFFKPSDKSYQAVTREMRTYINNIHIDSSEDTILSVPDEKEVYGDNFPAAPEPSTGAEDNSTSIPEDTSTVPGGETSTSPGTDTISETTTVDEMTQPGTIQPEESDPLKPEGGNIKIGSIVEEIPYEITETEDPTIPEGKTIIKTRGKKGSKLVKYKEYFDADGNSQYKITTEITVLEEPVNEVILKGTRTAPTSGLSPKANLADMMGPTMIDENVQIMMEENVQTEMSAR